MSARRWGSLVLTLPTLALGVALAVGLPKGHAIEYGSACPALSADPTSVCYDQTTADAARLAAMRRVHLDAAVIEHGQHCWTPAPAGHVIPKWVVGYSPNGYAVTALPFDAAWAAAHRGWTVLAFCDTLSSSTVRSTP